MDGLFAEIMDDAAQVAYKEGSHRVCDPARTLARIAPIAEEIGILRVTDITPFDTLGVPVFQALRKGAKSLAVSHGKGISREGARVGAYMEAIERWHAENISAPARTATVAEMAPSLGYRLQDCTLFNPCFISSRSELEWVQAANLLTGETTCLPRLLIDMDFTCTGEPELPRFATSSNGLAIGNSMVETALHAACEVIERDAVARHSRTAPDGAAMIDIESIDAPKAAALIDRMRARGARLAVEAITGPTGISVMRVWLWHGDRDPMFGGFGCHPEAEVALLRALTEAAQSRLGYITGLAATVSAGFYAAKTLLPDVLDIPAVLRWSDVETSSETAIARELETLVRRVHESSGQPVLAVDLRKPSIGVPVVTVVIPGMLYDMP